MKKKNIKIVSLEMAKAPTLLSVWRFYNCQFPKSRWKKEYFLKFWKEKKRTSCGYALLQDGKLAGLVMGRLHLKKKEWYNLSMLAVGKALRGKGLGTMLVEEFAKQVFRKGYGKIFLHFRESNSRLKDFYSKFGFDNYKEDGYYRNGEKKFYMELRNKKWKN